MKKRMHQFAELLGWYGVLAILLAYGLLSFGYISSQDMAYHVLNLTGGAGIMVDAYVDKNYQPVALNLIWVVIALFAIGKILF